MNYLRSAWYAAAWVEEISERPLARTLIEQPLVFYRRKDGTAVALADRCAHRFAPLHLGRVIDDEIECTYHGLRYDSQGACVFNPHGDGRIPRMATVKAYPVADRYGLTWVWMGDPAAADVEAIPEFSFITDPTFQNVKGYTLANGNYELMTDNIMDLGHIEFLHPGLLGSEAVRKAASEVYQRGTTVHSNRRTRDERLPPFIARWYEAVDKRVERWLNVRWDAPAVMKLSIGVLPSGLPADAAHESQTCHLMTPETATTTHYFWAQGRNWGAPDPEMDRGRLESLLKAFNTQDKPMIEAVQRNMGTTDLDSLGPVMLSTDLGPIKARRVLAQLICQEQSRASQAA